MIKHEIRSFFHATCDKCKRTAAAPGRKDIPLSGVKFCLTEEALLTYLIDKESWVVQRNSEGAIIGTFCYTCTEGINEYIEQMKAMEAGGIF